MKNPKECFCLRQNQTFFVLNELTMATGDDGSEPLTFHHETFSRFKFVIINSDKKATTANIPVSELPGIFEEVRNKNILKKMNSSENKTFGMINSIGKMTQKLVYKLVGQPSGASSAATKVDTNSPAFTLAISAGQLKGKTPVAALLENAEVNKKLLLNQIAWLEPNVNKYPRNKDQIKAIKEALDLYEKGLLNKNVSATVSSATATTNNKTDPNVIYHTGFRPLVRRTTVANSNDSDTSVSVSSSDTDSEDPNKSNSGDSGNTQKKDSNNNSADTKDTKTTKTEEEK